MCVILRTNAKIEAKNLPMDLVRRRMVLKRKKDDTMRDTHDVRVFLSSFFFFFFSFSRCVFFVTVSLVRPRLQTCGARGALWAAFECVTAPIGFQLRS